MISPRLSRARTPLRGRHAHSGAFAALGRWASVLDATIVRGIHEDGAETARA